MVFSALGDIAALLPYLRMIEPKPTIITSYLGKELLKDEFKDFLLLDSKKMLDVIRLIISVRKLKLDELIDFQCNDRSRFISKFSFSKRVFNNHGIDTDSPVHVILSKMSQRAMIFDSLKLKREEKKNGQYIVLNAGSSEKWSSKRLPFGKWREISEYLYYVYKLPFILTGALDEVDYVNEVAEYIKGDVINKAGSTSIIELKYLLRDAKLTVSTDSGPMHISSVMGTPTIGIFGATSWIKSAPFGPWSIAIYDRTYFLDDKPMERNSLIINEDLYANIDIKSALKKIKQYI